MDSFLQNLQIFIIILNLFQFVNGFSDNIFIFVEQITSYITLHKKLHTWSYWKSIYASILAKHKIILSFNCERNYYDWPIKLFTAICL